MTLPGQRVTTSDACSVSKAINAPGQCISGGGNDSNDGEHRDATPMEAAVLSPPRALPPTIQVAASSGPIEPEQGEKEVPRPPLAAWHGSPPLTAPQSTTASGRPLALHGGHYGQTLQIIKSPKRPSASDTTPPPSPLILNVAGSLFSDAEPCLLDGGDLEDCEGSSGHQGIHSLSPGLASVASRTSRSRHAFGDTSAASGNDTVAGATVVSQHGFLFDGATGVTSPVRFSGTPEKVAGLDAAIPLCSIAREARTSGICDELAEVPFTESGVQFPFADLFVRGDTMELAGLLAVADTADIEMSRFSEPADRRIPGSAAGNDGFGSETGASDTMRFHPASFSRLSGIPEMFIPATVVKLSKTSVRMLLLLVVRPSSCCPFCFPVALVRVDGLEMVCVM